MRFLPLLFTFFCLRSSAFLFAQCPPPGFPNPGDNCGSPIICENLDGYCNTINNNNQARFFACCTGFTLNNDEWFGFFAGSTTISIDITPSSCMPGANGDLGLQSAIYKTCPPNNPNNQWCIENLMDAQCSCEQNTFTLTSTNFEVGQLYWLVFDGCSGSVCDYAVDVTAGQTTPFPPDAPGAVTGPTPICQGATGAYSLPLVTGASAYTWTIVPASAGTVTGSGNSINVNWASNFSGSAQLCVKVSNTCFQGDTSCLTVDVLPKPTATLSGSGAICSGPGGSINLTVTLTGDPEWIFVYAINGVNQPPVTISSSPYTIVATQPGNYTPTSVASIDSDPDCAGTVSGSALVTTVKIMPTSTTVSAICSQNNGSIDLSHTGGNVPFSYNWSNAQTTQDLTNVSPGTYTVTITDAINCTKTYSATVSDSISNPTLSADLVNNTGCTSGNGSINLTATPSNNHTYQWSNGATTEDLSNITGGLYTVTVNAGGSCTASATYALTDTSIVPNATAVPTQSTCEFYNGSIDATVSGGVPPYTYLWSNGATTEDLFNIPAGNYHLTVTGANNCIKILSVNVTNDNPVFSISPSIVHNSACNNGNGSINLNVTPSNNYSFTWSNGAMTQNISNLTAANYSVTVSAGGACVQSATYTVNDVPNLPSPDAVSTPSSCGFPNGSINASVTAGAAPFTYLWSNGATSEDLSNISAGTYTLTVTGANSCSMSITVSVTNNPSSVLASISLFNNISCNGGNNGSVTATGSGGSGSYSYLWDNGATSATIFNLTVGTYNITVTDSLNCTATASITLSQPALLLPNATATGETSFGAKDGTASANPTGGTSDYTYIWSNGSTTQTITNLSPDSYSVTVTDSNGCTAIQTVTVSAYECALMTTITATDATCHGSNDGQASVNLIGASNPVTYAWSNGDTTQSINNLAAGTYTVTVSDMGACYLVQSINLGQPALLTANVVQIQNVLCPQDTTGSAEIEVSGGTAPYTYEWPGGKNENLGVGSYIVTITDAHSCKASASFNIVATDNQLPIIACPFDIKICGANLVSYPLAIALDNCGLIGSPVVINGPPSGSFFMEGTTTIVYKASDASGNTATCSFSVFVQTLPAILIDTVFNDINGQGVGAIFISPTASGSYTYQWNKNGQAFATTEDLTGLGAGFYSLTITDENGCTSTFPPIIVTNTVGLNELVTSGSVHLWPNPAESTIQLEIIDLDVIEAQIVDMRGSLIKVIKPSELNNKIEIRSMPQGTYCFKLSCENGQVLSIKFEKMGN